MTSARSALSATSASLVTLAVAARECRSWVEMSLPSSYLVSRAYLTVRHS